MSKTSWLEQFDTRQQKEIDLARLYAAQYDHGTPGHQHYVVIARLAALLDAKEGIETHYSIARTLTEISE